MTEETKNKFVEEYNIGRSKFEKIEELAKKEQEEARGEVRSEAIKELNKILLSEADKIEGLGGALNEETLKNPEARRNAIAIIADVYKLLSGKGLQGDPEKIINSAPEKGLESLIFTDEFGSFIEERDNLQKYRIVLGTERIAKEYLNKKLDLRSEQAGLLYDRAGKILQKEIEKSAKDQGYTEEIQKIYSSLAMLAVQVRGIKEDYLTKAANEIVEEVEGKKDKKENQREEARNFVRSNLVKLAKSKETEKFMAGYTFTNKAYRATA